MPGLVALWLWLELRAARARRRRRLRSNLFADAQDVSAVLHQLAGFASLCWENPAGAGEFQLDQASQACREAAERLQELAA